MMATQSMRPRYETIHDNIVSIYYFTVIVPYDRMLRSPYSSPSVFPHLTVDPVCCSSKPCQLNDCTISRHGWR